MKRTGGLLLALVLAVGCGGVRATSFSSNAKPMAQKMVEAAKTKNLDMANQIVAKAEQAFSNNRLVPSELNVLKAARDYGAKGEWDKAEALMTDSVAQSN